jgi:acetyl-CoA C-acetyltransferase
MAQAYVVAALRTAGARKGGRLSGWHPADLAAEVIDALVERTGIDPARVDDVVLGCVSQVGEQSTNIARNAVLASSLPQSVPGTTVDRQCGSSQQALHFAAQAVMSGSMDVVVAGGVESMTRVPMFSASELARDKGMGHFVSPRIAGRFGVGGFSQFNGAEMMARKYGLAKDRLDEFALRSHRLAAAAAREGRFEREIVPLPMRTGDETQCEEMHASDEGVRANATLEGIAGVKTLQEGGLITAANASQICDGASGVLVVNERGLKDLGLPPMARVHRMTVVGHDPVVMLEAPIPATEAALASAGMGIDDIDLFEVNEAFAPVPLAWLQATGADPARLNVNGGAIALGHPLGASGTRLAATLLHELSRTGRRWGLQTMCEHGGLANVTIFENLLR